MFVNHDLPVVELISLRQDNVANQRDHHNPEQRHLEQV